MWVGADDFAACRCEPPHEGDGLRKRRSQTFAQESRSAVGAVGADKEFVFPAYRVAEL
jgi:hypothetical protein